MSLSKRRVQALSLDAMVDNVIDRFVLAVTDAIDERIGRLDREPRLLDRRGLAELLDCGVDTVDRLRKEGIPEVKVGDAPRYEKDCVLAWLREREAKS